VTETESQTETRPAGGPGVALTTLTAMVVGSMVGPGLLAAAALRHRDGHPRSLIAWLIAGTGMLMLAFVFQTLAVRKPNLDSGVYAYAKAGFGEYLGFFSGSATGRAPAWATSPTGC
jgi:arginine:ornithine antiporter/lysine permease